MQQAAPKIANLGNCVIESNQGEFLVMFADGNVRRFAGYATACHAISRYFAKHTPKDAIGVGQIVSYDGSITTKAIHDGLVFDL